MGWYVTSPPSPTKQVFPKTLVDSTAAILVSANPAASKEESHPNPPVRFFICSDTSPFLGLTISQAPQVFAMNNLSSEISTAITLAPISFANIVAANPTGPCPNIAKVSNPEISNFFSA